MWRALRGGLCLTLVRIILGGQDRLSPVHVGGGGVGGGGAIGMVDVCFCG